jgi:hypothetical protein
MGGKPATTKYLERGRCSFIPLSYIVANLKPSRSSPFLIFFGRIEEIHIDILTKG